MIANDVAARTRKHILSQDSPGVADAGQQELDQREVAQHLMLFHHLSQAMGGPVPPEIVELDDVCTVLDVGCGAGGWALDLACTYPHLQVTGIDASARSIASAHRLAHEDGFSNVYFLVQDPCHLLEAETPLPAAPFDLIHVSFIAPALLSMNYLALLRALWRLCCPGGMLSWTEMEFPLTNSPALEQIFMLTCDALCRAGHCFTPQSTQAFTGFLDSRRHTVSSLSPCAIRRHLEITLLMGSWLHEAGYQHVQQVPVAIEVSSGTEAHSCFTRQVEAFTRQICPFLIAQGVILQDALAQLCTQIKAEVQHETFCGFCFLLSVLGRAPGPENAKPL